MKNYLSIREAAEKWGVSERRINQYCAEGRIPGVQRFGKSWAIPAGAEKPGDPRRRHGQAESARAETDSGALLDNKNLMLLMNTAFVPGHCREAVEAMPAGPQRNIALAEYYYFSGQPEAAVKEAEFYLDSSDRGARLSACLICAYANLSIGQILRARSALEELNASLAAAQGNSRLRFGQRRLLSHRPGRCCFICRCRRLTVSCLCCRQDSGRLPCMCRPTISI